MKAHIHCLALAFLSNDIDQLLPTAGKCPACLESVKWPDVIESKKKRERLRGLNLQDPKNNENSMVEQREKTRKNRQPLLQLQQHRYVPPVDNKTKRANTEVSEAEPPTKRTRPTIQSLYS